MPIRVKCEQCKKTLSVKDPLAGKKIKCPVCQTVLQVPAASPGAPPDAPGAKTPAPQTPAPAVPKKPAAVGKLVAASKPVRDKPKANGPGPAKNDGIAPPGGHAKNNGAAPPANPTKNNGTPAAPVEPPPAALPPENVEEEALAAFADAPPPKVDDTTPKTIDFKCEYCDEMVSLPFEMGGKQSQCPNPECKRIIKVPMPKIEGPKDWRKMDRKGPAAALVSQPEQLEDAWGTQEATQARQASLAQAGALAEPPKPKRDAAGWLILSVKVIFVFTCIALAIGGVWRLVVTKQQHNAIAEAKNFIDPGKGTVKNPLLAAEVNRTLALLYLREPKGAPKALDHFNGAKMSVHIDPFDKKPAINEQFFRRDLALASIELDGHEDDLIRSTRKKVGETVLDVLNAVLKDLAPEAQVIATREVATRLIEKKQLGMAVGIASALAGESDDPVRSQNIALFVLRNEEEARSEFFDKKDPCDATELEDASLRIGFAEGYARKGEFDKAFKLALVNGPAKDKLEACVGVAAVALLDRKNEEASKFVKEAVKIVEAKSATGLTDWNYLELARLAARTEDADTVKKIAENLKAPEFKTRVLFEVFLAKCEKAPGKIDVLELADLEADFEANKESKDNTDNGVTLALAWNALARHNARMGASRNENRATFKNRADVLALPVDLIRPMIDVGTYLGAAK